MNKPLCEHVNAMHDQTTHPIHVEERRTLEYGDKFMSWKAISIMKLKFEANALKGEVETRSRFCGIWFEGEKYSAWKPISVSC